MDVARQVVRENKGLATVFIITQLLFIAGVVTGFFSQGSVYDKIVHFILPATGAPLLYSYLQGIGFLSGTKNKMNGMLVIFLLAVTAEALWEIFEFTLDHTLGSNWQYGNFDTMVDIIMATAGGVLGALWYAYRPDSMGG